jgi:hypothetical protein
MRSPPGMMGQLSRSRSVSIFKSAFAVGFLIFCLTVSRERRVGKPPEVINRWLGAPSNLTSDSICDLLLGICGEEMEMTGVSLLNRESVIVKVSDGTANSGTIDLTLGTVHYLKVA